MKLFYWAVMGLFPCVIVFKFRIIFVINAALKYSVEKYLLVTV